MDGIELSFSRWIDKLCVTDSMEYYLAVKSNDQEMDES